MIVGKNSALIGFSLFAWLIVAVLALIPCVEYNTFFGIVGLINLALNGCVVYKLFTHFSNRNKEPK